MSSVRLTTDFSICIILVLRTVKGIRETTFSAPAILKISSYFRHDLTPEGICIYAITTEEHPRLVVEREYRFPVDEMIYQLPAGLIDPGETPGEAAMREMREETGFEFTEYTGGEAFCRRPFFLAPGFTDEPGSAVFGRVMANVGRELESTEWIEVILADKAEVRRILAEEKLSLRAAFLMMQFLAMPDDDPFRFLECR